MADRLGTDLLRAFPRGIAFPVEVEAATTIDANSLVGVIAASGYAEPYDEAVTYSMVGYAKKSLDNSAGANGDVVAEGGEVVIDVIAKFTASGMSVANMGDAVYASGPSTVTVTPSTNTHVIGHIVEVESATAVYVHITGYVS